MTASLRSAVAATLPKGKIYFLQTGEVPKIYSSGLSGVSRFFYFQRFFIINGISIFCKHLCECTNYCQINNDKMAIYVNENNFKKFQPAIPKRRITGVEAKERFMTRRTKQNLMVVKETIVILAKAVLFVSAMMMIYIVIMMLGM